MLSLSKKRNRKMKVEINKGTLCENMQSGLYYYVNIKEYKGTRQSTVILKYNL